MENTDNEQEIEWCPPRGRWGAETGAAMVAAFEASGLSMSAFATKHGVGTHRVSYWREKATAAKVSHARPSGFVRVRVATAAVSPAEPLVEVRLRNGRTLTIRGAWNEASVRTWVDALEASS